MKKYSEYVAPKLSIMTLAASDVITSSVAFDSSDNWTEDVFPANGNLSM